MSAGKNSLLPSLTRQELEFCRAIFFGKSASEAYIHSYLGGGDEDDGSHRNTRRNRGEALLQKDHIQQFLAYLRNVSGSDQLVDDVYFNALVFGDEKQRLRAAKDYLSTRFTGADAALRFIELLQAAHAEIVLPCPHAPEGVHRQKI